MKPAFLSGLVLAASLLSGQTADLALPQWLIPYPGATAVPSGSSTLVESSYTAAAKPEDVSQHYTKLLASRGVAFHVNSDGLGTAIRVSAPECDLLIQMRESDSGTGVKVSCASKQASAAQAGSGGEVVVVRQDGGGGRDFGSGHHLKSAEEIKRYNQERAAEIKARREAIEQQATVRMQQYDKPVYPQAQGRTVMAPAAMPSAPIAHYRDDAPELVWPSWLVSVAGERLSQPKESTRGPESSVSRKYQTTAAMTEVERFYKEALTGNGFTIRKSGISTGSTSTGVKQNASGEVEGYRADGSGVNPPSTTIKVGFSRMYLNEPITVWISVSVKGSFGR